MKVSAAFAQAQLDRARQIISRRKLITAEHIGQLVTLTIQGDGNMLTSRPAMIYNTTATTQSLALQAKKLLGTSSFFTAIADMGEEGVIAYMNSILNSAQLSFTVPLTSSQTFSNRDVVTALVEEYSRKATDENPTPGKGIGLNGVKLAKAVAAGNAASVFGNWDDEEETTLEDGSEAPTGEDQQDPFAAEHVEEKTPATEDTKA